MSTVLSLNYCVYHDSNSSALCRDVRCDKCPNRVEFIPKKADVDRFIDQYKNAVGRQEKADYAPNKPKPDQVMHPNHYSRWKMEPIEFIAINDLPWWLANVIKYTMRYDAKDGLQDLYKARSYLDMKIRQIEGTPRFWDKPVAEERSLNKAAK